MLRTLGFARILTFQGVGIQGFAVSRFSGCRRTSADCSAYCFADVCAPHTIA